MPSEIRVRCGRASEPRVVRVPTGVTTTVVIEENRCERATLEGFFHTESAFFLPSRPASFQPVERVPFALEDETQQMLDNYETVPILDETDNIKYDGEVRDSRGLEILAGVMAFVSDQQRHLLIAGHADTSGQNAYNDDLSSHRANCVCAIMEGNKDKFVAALRTFSRIEDECVVLQHYHRRRGWPCDTGDPTTSHADAVRGFQEHYNNDFDRAIAVDGDIGKETRGAMFDLYQAELAGLLGGETEVAKGRAALRPHGAQLAIACGERFPGASFSPARDIDDRRVELLLFHPEDPVPTDEIELYQSNVYTFLDADFELPSVESEGVDIGTEFEHPEPEPEPDEYAAPTDYVRHDEEDPFDFLNAFIGGTLTIPRGAKRL